MSLICSISDGMFPSQSAPKVPLHPNKDIIFIMELYKLQKIERKSTRSSLGSKTQTLYFWNNHTKLTLKHYIGVLFATWSAIFCVNFLGKLEKIQEFRFCDLGESNKDTDICKCSCQL